MLLEAVAGEEQRGFGRQLGKPEGDAEPLVQQVEDRVVRHQDADSHGRVGGDCGWERGSPGWVEHETPVQREVEAGAADAGAYDRNGEVAGHRHQRQDHHEVKSGRQERRHAEPDEG